MNIALFWASLPQWLRDALKIAGAILAVIFLGKAFINAEKDKARKEERKRAEAETITVVHEIEKESQTDADKAAAARAAAPHITDPRELPDEVANRIFRD